MIEVALLLSKGATCRKVEAGEVIFSEGASPLYYYQLVEGRVRWSNFFDNGKETMHWLVQDGECFGEFALFDGKPYVASAVADIPSTVLRLSADAFHELLAENHEIHLEFSKGFARHLRFKFMFIRAMGSHSPEKMLKELIDYYTEEGKHVCKKCRRLMLTRQQLANISGLRVETVIRAMKLLQRDNRICIVKGKVIV